MFYSSINKLIFWNHSHFIINYTSQVTFIDKWYWSIARIKRGVALNFLFLIRIIYIHCLSFRYIQFQIGVFTPIHIMEHIWEKVPIGNWSHHVGFILELCSRYEINIWHVGKGYVLQCFWSSRDSSTLCFNILWYLVLLQHFICNASWEILNRTFFNRISK